MPSVLLSKHQAKNFAEIPKALVINLYAEIHQLYSTRKKWSPFVMEDSLKITSAFDNRYSADIDLLLDSITFLELKHLKFELQLGKNNN